MVSNQICQTKDDFIYSLRNEGVKTPKDINCGWCVEFAEEIEYQLHQINYYNCTAITSDFLVEPEELPDSSFVQNFNQEQLNEFHVSSEIYEEYKQKVVKVNDSGAIGYHAWLFDKQTRKHYDIECHEGVENLFELPYFLRHAGEYNQTQK